MRPAGQGVYHINAVDQVTQWEIVAATERISEAWLEPVLCALMRQFPFRILGFHSDNGSEFINRIVARLLNKLLIEQNQKPPPAQQRQWTGRNQEWRRHPQTHGLRLYPGRARRAPAAVLHRLLQSLSPTTIARAPKADITFDEKGRRRWPLPPLSDSAGTLLTLPNPAQYLRPGLTPAVLPTHRGNPQRHRSRTAHAAGQTPALRALAATRGRAVEMTEDKNPQPQERGFFLFLGKRKKTKARFPTIPTARLRLLDWFRNLNLKGASSTTVQPLPQAHPSIGKRLEDLRERHNLPHPA